MAQFLFPFDTLSANKCYTLNVNVADFASNITFTIGDLIVQEPVGVATGNGDFSFDFNTGDTILYGVLDYTSTAASIYPDMRIDLACADAACSECFDLLGDKNCNGNTVTINYYNNENAFGFNYSNTTFQQTIVVRGGLERAEYINNDEGIYNSSNGTKFLHYVNHRKQKDLNLNRIPPYLHDAIAIALVHDHVFLDGIEYVKPEGDYTPDYETESFLARVVTRVEEKTQNLFNRNC